MEAKSKTVKYGKVIILLLLVALAGILIYRGFFMGKIGGGKTTRVPKEMQLKYIPANYEFNIDEDEAMVILSNPRKNRRDFDDLVKKINISIIKHVSTRMGLSDELKSKAIKEYLDNHHDYIKDLYYKDFLSLKDTTSVLYQTWYDNEYTNAVEVLEEVSSKYTCFLINDIMSTILKTQNGSIYGKGKNVDTPCGIALTEALRPLMKRMEEKAAIDDFSRSKGLLQEKMERVIAELATMEIRDKKGITKNLQTKIWGIEVSSSDIEIVAISIMKIGFKLDDYFKIDLNAKNKIVTVTLPQPVILSHEVYPKIDKLDIGWMREVESIDLNKGMNTLRENFRQDAINSDAMDKAKTQAIELMNSMFGPMIKSMDGRYELRVRFKEVEEHDPEDLQG